MRIGYRTLKTAVATPIAIFVASILGVTNVVSAGIFTMLCIQPSRKQSVQSAGFRIIGSIIAIILSILLFESLGYNFIILSMALMIFISISVALKIEQAIMTSTVIMLNLFSFGSINLSFIQEQFSLTFIGVGIGLIVNLYMPDLTKPLNKLQRDLEDRFQIILHEISLYIKEDNLEWDGKEIQEVEEILKEADALVERDRENNLFKENLSFDVYFSMRSKQFELLKQMLPIVTHLPKRDIISEKTADFFEALAQAVHPGDTATVYLFQLDEVRQLFNDRLPKTQEEFEARSAIFQLLFLIEEYLKIKHKYREPEKQKINWRKKNQV